MNNMSKLFCCFMFAFILIINCTCNAIQKSNQKQKFILARLDYENPTGEKGTTYFDYESNGLSNLSLWELTSGLRFSLNFHYYDSNGNLIKKFREYSDHKNTLQLYTYNNKNKLIAEEFILQDTSRGISNFEYDSNGNMIRINCIAYNGWLNGTINIGYDESGLRKKGELFQKGKRSAEIFYTYDENNNLIKEEWKFANGWYQIFNYIYELADSKTKTSYTSSNPFITNETACIVKENYQFGDKQSGPSFYKYDQQKKLSEKVFERSDGFKTNTFYIYNSKGVLQSAFRRFSNGNCALFRYEFNDNRKMTLKEFFRNDKVYGKEIFIYNSSGKLTEGEFINSDFWLTGKLFFKVSEDGIITHGTYKDVNNYSAGIEFKYNNERNVTSIDWKFSNGMKQSYQFEYKTKM